MNNYPMASKSAQIVRGLCLSTWFLALATMLVFPAMAPAQQQHPGKLPEGLLGGDLLKGRLKDLKKRNLIDEPDTDSQTTEQQEEEQQEAAPKEKRFRSEADFSPSFGEYRTSIFLDKSQQRMFIDALISSEKRMFLGGSRDKATAKGLFDATEEAAPKQLLFPYYRLGSIVYNNKRSWFISVNGMTLSNSANDEVNELYVEDITNERVTFAWLPSDDRIFEKLQVALDESDAIGDGESNIDHRLDVENTNNIRIEEGQVRFTLEPNQLFLSRLQKVYEGMPADIIRMPAEPSQTAETQAEGEDSASKTPPPPADQLGMVEGRGMGTEAAPKSRETTDKSDGM